MHPLGIACPQRARIYLFEVRGQTVAVGIRAPVARPLVVAGKHGRNSVQLTCSMPCKWDGGAVDAALCQNDCATRCRKLPDIGQRQRHQIPGYASGEDLVTHAADAIVHVVTGYPMYGGIGSGSNGRVPHRGIRRKNIELRLSEPGPPLPQCRERWHERGVPIEVVATHAIENDQYDHPRRSNARLQDGQHTASRRWRHMDAKRSRHGWCHILLRGPHGIRPGLDRGACKHQRDRDVIRPGRAVHIGDIRVGPRDEIAFTWHDQKLAGATRKIGPCKHVEETLLCSLGLARRRFARVRLMGCGCLSRVLTGSRTTNHEESCGCQKDTKEEEIHADLLRARILAAYNMLTSPTMQRATCWGSTRARVLSSKRPSGWETFLW